MTSGNNYRWIGWALTDHRRWSSEFLANWPIGSAAWTSYWPRIMDGARYSLVQAAPPSNPLALGQAAR